MLFSGVPAEEQEQHDLRQKDRGEGQQPFCRRQDDSEIYRRKSKRSRKNFNIQSGWFYGTKSDDDDQEELLSKQIADELGKGNSRKEYI